MIYSWQPISPSLFPALYVFCHSCLASMREKKKHGTSIPSLKTQAHLEFSYAYLWTSFILFYFCFYNQEILSWWVCSCKIMFFLILQGWPLSSLPKNGFEVIKLVEWLPASPYINPINIKRDTCQNGKQSSMKDDICEAIKTDGNNFKVKTVEIF